jgi:hypothetical protein
LVLLSEPNYAGNIIIILANLPDFLRTPILKKRMLEFFSMTETEQDEIINNALEAGPTIPFSNFLKLFKTWLEVLSTISEDQRNLMFLKYINAITNTPEKLINFNLDGIYEIFSSLDKDKKNVITKTLKNVIFRLEAEQKRKLKLIIPEKSKIEFGI